jgi:multiple sugar transport system permease protein
MSNGAPSAFWLSKKRQESARNALAFTVISIMSLVMLIPLAWMLVISLKEPQNVFQMPPWSIDWQWKNYGDAWYLHGYPSYIPLSEADGSQPVQLPAPQPTAVTDPAGIAAAVATSPVAAVAAPVVTPAGERMGTAEIMFENVKTFFLGQGHKGSFWVYLWNTLFITMINVLGVTISSAVVAFGFARMRFPGRGALFVLVLATLMIPAQVTMIPSFILFTKLGWTNTFLPLTLPAYFGGGAYNIFLLRQFFMTIPTDLDDAAKIDGCSTFGIFWRIMLPLTKPALTTVAVFCVVYNWNDFMNPLIYLSDAHYFTLSLGLTQFRSLYATQTHLMMAASAITLIPLAVIFLMGQRYFIQGIATTGLKG